MIYLRDLRIGNLIETVVGAERRVSKVASFQKVECIVQPFIRVGVATDMGTVVVEQCFPIPLTPEILEQFGFVWETQDKRHLELFLPDQDINKRNISFCYLDGKCDSLQMYMSDYFDGYFEIKPPQYVHQLQNLYKSLTGEELEVNILAW